MNLDSDLIDAIFAKYGITDQWIPLQATGVANLIYATTDIVLRVATDHDEAVEDARTESIAAPIANSAGILTPRMIAFDDSRTLVDRPFSLWERVHGETLGLLELNQSQLANVWRQVGRELSRLHNRVRACPDPNGYLDAPERQLDTDSLLQSLANSNRIDNAMAEDISQLISELAPYVASSVEVCFLHGDIHDMNVMCSSEGDLLAIIDWGDAGWGDPTLDFAAIPLHSIPYAVEGYESETPGALGKFPEARFIWDKLHYTLQELLENPEQLLSLNAFRRFLVSKSGITSIAS